MKNALHIPQTNSTNALLWKMVREEQLPEGFLLHTDFQTAGKGQAQNSWESEAGLNLLFSIVLYPHHIHPCKQFIISQLVSVAIQKVLSAYTDNITVKWPNDIYWHDKKLAGILIENSLQGSNIKTLIIGIGLNVNQAQFVSNAPNPVSLKQIIGKELSCSDLLRAIHKEIMHLYQQLDTELIQKEYAEILYRKEGFHLFSVNGVTFQAKIQAIHSDGQLELETKDSEKKGFYFKEVQFII